MTHIPLKSGSEIMLEIQAGRLDVDIGTMQVAQQGLPTGKVKMLAITSVEPLPFLPGVPTLAEADVPGLEALDPYTFFGLVGPQGMPDDVVRELNEAVNEVLQMPHVQKRMSEVAYVNPMPGSASEFQEYLNAQYKKWTEIGKGLKLD